MRPVAVIETIKYRLVAGADLDDFIASDQAFQTGFSYRQAGLIRRTNARGGDGSWLAIEIWDSADAADAAKTAFDARRERAGDVVSAHMAHIDGGSVDVERFETLD